jgi:hypothetical protein
LISVSIGIDGEILNNLEEPVPFSFGQEVAAALKLQGLEIKMVVLQRRPDTDHRMPVSDTQTEMLKLHGLLAWG